MIRKRKKATISRSRPPSPTGGLWNTTVVGENVFLPLALPSSESRLNRHPRGQGKPRIFVAHGCMLIPVAVGIWWFYFRRKTSSVFRKLLVKNRPEEQQQTASRPRGAYEEDEFSTWEEVNNHNIADPSVRFVRWIKARNLSSAQRRAQVRNATRRTMEMASSPRTAQMSTPILDSPMVDKMDDESQSAASANDASKRSQWQCLKDVGVDVIELCSVVSPAPSHDGSLPSPPVPSVIV